MDLACITSGLNVFSLEFKALGHELHESFVTRLMHICSECFMLVQLPARCKNPVYAAA